jgi:translocating chain-associated membrane protein 1
MICKITVTFYSQKISRKLHLSKVKHSKFNESGQLLIFYLMSVLWAGDVIVRYVFGVDIQGVMIIYS